MDDIVFQDNFAMVKSHKTIQYIAHIDTQQIKSFIS